MAILLRFAPWLAVIAILIGIYAAGGTIVRHWEANMVHSGREAQKAEDDAASQRLATAIQTGVSDHLDAALDRKLAALKPKTTILKGNIDAAFKATPMPSTCVVPDRVFDARNDIRRETGDTPDARPSSENGSKPNGTPANN